MTTRKRKSRSPTRKRAGSKAEIPGSIEVDVLLDLARPWRSRKLPPPGASVVYDRHYSDLEHEGFLQWVQVHPHHQSMSDDHYELTRAGHARVTAYRQWLKNLATPRRPRHGNLDVFQPRGAGRTARRHGDLGPQVITEPGSKPGLVNLVMVNHQGTVLHVLQRDLPYNRAVKIIRGQPLN